MSPEQTISQEELADLVGEIELPCEYDRIFRCGPSAATWEMRAACGCGALAVRLVCECCKDFTMQTEDGFSCGDCGVVTVPARHLFWLVNRL